MSGIRFLCQLQTSGLHEIRLLPLERAEHVDQLGVQALGLGDGFGDILRAQQGLEGLQRLEMEGVLVLEAPAGRCLQPCADAIHSVPTRSTIL